MRAAAKAQEPIITFPASVRSEAPPEAVYAVLADLSTHLIWAGEQAPGKGFRLLSLELDTPAKPGQEATVGDRWSSTGSNILSMHFEDTSVVVESVPARCFAFDTTSTTIRKHRPAWHARFTHRYTITSEGSGSRIDYVCDCYPQNYVPWWLTPMQRPMMRVSVPRAIRRNMANLAAMASERVGLTPHHP